MASGESNSYQKREHDFNDNSPNNKRQRPDSSTITDLDDHCLEKIFVHLDLIELLNVTDANGKLRPTARFMYKHQFGGKAVVLTPSNRLNIPNSGLSENANNIYVSGLKRCLQYLRCFGSSIIRLVIKNEGPECKRYEYIHQYIDQYCAGSLEDILFFNKRGAVIPNFGKPMVSVQMVQAMHCDLGNQFASFPQWFPNMRALELIGVCMNNVRIDSPFHNLRQLHIDIGDSMSHRGLTQQQVTNLLPLCSRLIALEIRTPSPQMISMATVLGMIKSNPMIRILVVSLFKVRMTVNSSEIQRLAAEHPNLIKIDFEDYEFTADAAITLVRQLNQLEKFRFQISDLSECDRMVSQLDDQWQPSIHTDFLNAECHYITLTR